MSTPAISLGHIMDARGENLRQDRLIAALDTPEIDSAAEVAMLITDPQVRSQMLKILAEIRRSNRSEGSCERDAAGALDQASTIAHTERVRATKRALTVRGAANLLRPLLRDDRAGGAGARWALLQSVRDCRTQMDPAYLTGRGMRNELGRDPFVQLQALLVELDAVVVAS